MALRIRRNYSRPFSNQYIHDELKFLEPRSISNQRLKPMLTWDKDHMPMNNAKIKPMLTWEKGPIQINKSKMRSPHQPNRQMTTKQKSCPRFIRHQKLIRPSLRKQNSSITREKRKINRKPTDPDPINIQNISFDKQSIQSNTKPQRNIQRLGSIFFANQKPENLRKLFDVKKEQKQITLDYNHLQEVIEDLRRRRTPPLKQDGDQVWSQVAEVTRSFSWRIRKLIRDRHLGRGWRQQDKGFIPRRPSTQFKKDDEDHIV